jgi:hypothetical protein
MSNEQDDVSEDILEWFNSRPIIKLYISKINIFNLFL